MSEKPNRLPAGGPAAKKGSSQSNVPTSTFTEEEAKNIVMKRFDAIKNKDEAAVRELVDDRYDKFDDWPPFERQDHAKALENEFGAFKVLANYTYDLKDFKADIFGGTAVATFIIHYNGKIRNSQFDVTSRATTVLVRSDAGWKIVHEHFSRFPEPTRQQYAPPRRMMQP